MKKKTGIVDVGGGMRGIYAAGVFDFCLDAGIRFDLGIGVSAGSANLASFAAGQSQRNQRFLRNILNENNIWVGKISSARALSWIWTIFMEPLAIPQE